MDWVRGEKLGNGSFGMVNIAIPRSRNCQIPPVMAVKSCGVSLSDSLMNEKLILDELKDCPEIIRCFGENFTDENGEKLYNILLEYASGGALADKVKNCPDNGLPESEVRRYTKALLKGLNYIHKFGYVHCDIKLQNILLGPNGGVKIADFGLAKRAEREKVGDFGCELRGTPLYMSPEMATRNEQGPPADIWALGCVVAEMVGGASPWRCSGVADLLMRIGVRGEVPEVPENLSSKGKDFLGKCFANDPSKRWTAEMLLNHPFVDDQDFDDTVTLKERHDEDNASTSPRCPFDFPDWTITSLPSPEYSSESGSWFCKEVILMTGSMSTPPVERLQGLASNHQPHWLSSDEWLSVR
ncbi:mitogen-activated protein kinase kinase kinase 18-like [Olea europaea var. sylvestris]|uniref:Mitogen-activated kinase kinase kinase 3-like n=1 Tax=Olea europaea subsp. europaea TaxID=158383 RepID=A0A8S0PGZ3_OLEEU|nr:mitogen-activated protein kinase kinase kinase 18-like [Olea europaea var. sylvestris]CAA2946973.1 mitogen-activated kinase kinase kinase 3-like [Olea europaea subsp. europaea]